MSAVGRYCCKSLKRRSGQFLAKERNERESPINTASNPLRKSPMSLARGDLSPHIIIQSPRLRGGEFESHLQKRLLQQYLPDAENRRAVAAVAVGVHNDDAAELADSGSNETHVNAEACAGCFASGRFSEF